MIAPWMLWASLLGLVLVTAALGGETLLRSLRGPTRLAWACALVLASCVPLLLAARRAQPVAPVGLPLDLPDAQFGMTAPVRVPPESAETGLRLDGMLLSAWAVASLMLSVRVVLAAWRLARRRRQWTRHTLDGVEVYLSDHDGPAVAGLIRPRIVVPRWLAEAPRDTSALVLRHEAAHRAGRDPMLLAVATALRTLFPWNLALWFMNRRLRLAIEIDCDARVLRGGADPGAYGALLLDVAQRRSGQRMSLALLEPMSCLERRIRAMMTASSRQPFAAGRSLALVVLALGVACSMPQPAPLLPAASRAARPVHSVTERSVATAPAHAAATVADARSAVGRSSSLTVEPRAAEAPAPGQRTEAVSFDVPADTDRVRASAAVQPPEAARPEAEPALDPAGQTRVDVPLERLKRLVYNTYPDVTREGSADSAVWILYQSFDARVTYEARRTPLPQPLTLASVAQVVGVDQARVVSFSHTSYPVNTERASPVVDVVVTRVRPGTELPRPRQWRTFVAPVEDQDSVRRNFEQIRRILEREIPLRFPEVRTSIETLPLVFVFARDYTVLRAVRDTVPPDSRGGRQIPWRAGEPGSDWYGGMGFRAGILGTASVGVTFSVMPGN